jgi:hypothetical protein
MWANLHLFCGPDLVIDSTTCSGLRKVQPLLR